MRLSKEQRVAVDAPGHTVITACPGSGKTRVLTYRVLRGLTELKGTNQRVIALTFTNRAADEIQHRLDALNIPTDFLWAGTIHSFALKWILRPYAPYAETLSHGFAIADEHYSGRLMEEAKKLHQANQYLELKLGRPRSGENPNTGLAAQVFDTYKQRLRDERLLDYDDLLFTAYSILVGNPEIRQTLAAIMPLICVDEVQDIQDMQYAILSQIVFGTDTSSVLFFVGDANQSIYETLGALTKTPAQIAAEFGLPKIVHLKLSENYRSTQRIVDYFTLIRPHPNKLRSLASCSAEHGLIQFFDQKVHREKLPLFIAHLIQRSLDMGVSASDICVIAPRWEHIIPMARALVGELPHVDFDAPGLSPLHTNRDDVWFKLARLFLTGPRHGLDRTRHRWANDFVVSVERNSNVVLPEPMQDSRGLLRYINATTSIEEEGIAYLRDVFDQFLRAAAIDIALHPVLEGSHVNFFAKAEERIESSDGTIPSNVTALRRLFKSPSGVVVNTCHGVKGEEYHTVIALGLLHGYIPHWNTVINGSSEEAREQSSKLLYVVCSRAKERLFLIAESGRSTQRGRPYETTTQLRELKFDYDE